MEEPRPVQIDLFSNRLQNSIRGIRLPLLDPSSHRGEYILPGLEPVGLPVTFFPQVLPLVVQRLHHFKGQGVLLYHSTRPQLGFSNLEIRYPLPFLSFSPISVNSKRTVTHPILTPPPFTREYYKATSHGLGVAKEPSVRIFNKIYKFSTIKQQQGVWN